MSFKVSHGYIMLRLGKSDIINDNNLIWLCKTAICGEKDSDEFTTALHDVLPMNDER